MSPEIKKGLNVMSPEIKKGLNIMSPGTKKLKPTKKQVFVGSIEEMKTIIESLTEETTVIFYDGHYTLNESMRINVPDGVIFHLRPQTSLQVTFYCNQFKVKNLNALHKMFLNSNKSCTIMFFNFKFENVLKQ